ncbi:MAG: IS66 family transposase zinc-finger binding domain-containing protein [Comamonadaceae bacterium]|nr:IS66 family transposase zinc-finger binding domain-containing protein [Comamonadaceae bacterium]
MRSTAKLQQAAIKRRTEQTRTKVLACCGSQPNRWAGWSSRAYLRQVTEPDKIITHNVPDNCPACHGKLAFAYVAETRQVFDLPVLQCEVTEHRVMQAICACGHVHTAEFPADVAARVQYGPRAQAAMVHLNLNHAVP